MEPMGPIMENVWPFDGGDSEHPLSYGAWGTDCRTRVAAFLW